jgi:hypothetical protein
MMILEQSSIDPRHRARLPGSTALTSAHVAGRARVRSCRGAAHPLLPRGGRPSPLRNRVLEPGIAAEGSDPSTRRSRRAGRRQSPWDRRASGSHSPVCRRRRRTKRNCGPVWRRSCSRVGSGRPWSSPPSIRSDSDGGNWGGPPRPGDLRGCRRSCSFYNRFTPGRGGCRVGVGGGRSTG